MFRLEGYLAWEAEVAAARREAAGFVERFPWLSTGQREAVREAYEAERLGFAEGVFERAAKRSRGVAEFYRRRCLTICTRWAGACVAVMAGTALLAALPVLLRG
ncbi:cytochrome C oxidase subunit I [Kitasatospora sp. NPDC088346]|uniref:cytochrome C oxidase subunit I n=1 Tax=Kitasatospora sp. NPDC088346 TaxID=3364073 RepID=UPI0038008589